jgi:hypothetical protein
MMKNFTQAPLPFMGQKRRFLPEFKEALKQFDNCAVFVDLFGGSGLLSHVVKKERPDARVVYNDFDGYHVRIANVGRTNELLADLRIIVAKEPKDKKLDDKIKAAVLDRIKRDDDSGYVDYITLSSSLLFSMNYVTSYHELAKQTMYNCVRTCGYDCTGYLDGLEIVSQDYKQLFEFWRHHPAVVFLIDPPYLSTEVGTYTGYWKLRDYLDVLHTLKNTSYFYFTSNKSSIIELCDWLEVNYSAQNPFHGAIRKEVAARMNYNSSYTDIMLFKRRLNSL